jgi:cysteine-rich repeat protein
VVVVRRFLPASLAQITSACFVGVNDVEKPATGGAAGSGGTAASGGSAGSGNGGTGAGSTGGSGGTPNGGTGGVAGSGIGGSVQGGTGGTPSGGTGGTTIVGCGDKIVGSDEECDDGNKAVGDGCSDLCQVECSENEGEYLLSNKHCYRGVKDLSSWSAASTICAAWNGHLVSITSDDEVSVSNKIAINIGTPAWIGLTDETAESKYVWVDASPYSLTKWEPGEPNDVAHLENCVVIAGNSAGTGYSWYDEPCSMPYRAICERAVGLP